MNLHVGRPFRFLVMAAFALALTACAGTHIKNVVSVAQTVGRAAPRTIAIVVENDSPPPRHARHDAGHEADVSGTQGAIVQQLSTILASRGLIVVPQGQLADLVLHCQIADVHSGNVALRLVVGYGVGKADLKLNVALIDQRSPSHPTLLSFEARSTTGAGGGAAMGLTSGNTLDVAKSALGVPGTLKRDLPTETKQTTTHIDEELARYFEAQSWSYAKSVAIIADNSPVRGIIAGR